MLKQTAALAGGMVLALPVMFFLAGRPISNLIGYFQAGASSTLKTIEDEIPDVVHDEKTATELAAAREQLVDRRVQLNLSQNQLKNLEHEITALRQAIADRSQVLASAYPVLRNAVDGGQKSVSFASTKFSLPEFQHEIDDLLSMQKRDDKALRIKQAGYDRLKQGVADGETALASIKHKTLEIEQEFAILKTRRDQARMESETLDLVAGAASSPQSSTAEIGKSIGRLQGHVEQLEARNAARRDVAPIGEYVAGDKLTQSFNRLESLKHYADAVQLPQECEKIVEDLAAEDSVGSETSQPNPLDDEELALRFKSETATKGTEGDR